MRLRAPFLALLLLAVPFTAQAERIPPSDPKGFTWAEPGVLAIGGGGLTKSQVDWLHAQGFRAIADFRADHQDPEDHIRGKGMTFLDLPIDHAAFIGVAHIQRFIMWAREQEAAGRPMYVHCSNGWHRAAAFVTAWEMDRNGLTYDEAAQLVTERRPGTVMRAPAALLAYEAVLTGKPGLNVLLLSPLSRPEEGGTMPVTVQVLADGKPAEGAQVDAWSEESALRVSGVTDADGRFAFTYRSPKDPYMDHLYARASLEGFVDGADNVELFYNQPAQPGPIAIDAERTPEGIAVEVYKDGSPARSHITAMTDEGLLFRELSVRGRILLPPHDGAVTIRAERWGSDGAQVVVPPAEHQSPTPEPSSPPPVAPASHVEPPSIQGPPTPQIVAPTPDPRPGQAEAASEEQVEDRPTWSWMGVGLGAALILGASFAWDRRRRRKLA